MMPMDPPPFDPGNPLIGEQASLTTVTVGTNPQGHKRVIATVRTSSATLTVFMEAKEAQALAQQLNDSAREAAGGLIIPPVGNRYANGEPQ